MAILRRLILTHKAAALLAIAIALAMKAIVPAGFMPMLVEGRVVIALCPGSSPAVTMAHPAAMAHHEMPAVQHGGPSKPDTPQHDNKPQPCAFAGLTAPSLAGADPVVLAGAIAFVLALGVQIVVALPTIRPARLRPPLRGPPVIA